MSDNPESASIDLSVNADAALETMSQLANAAKEADADLQRLKTTMASQVNAAFGAAMGTTVDYSHAQNIVRGMQPADIAAALPGVPQIQQQIAERSGVVTGAALDVAGAPAAASQPIPQLLDQVRQLLMAQQAQQQTTAASAPSSATPGALHTSSVAPPSSLYTPASTDATQQDRGANVVGQRIAESLTRYAGGMLTGGIQGGASAAGMGGTGDLVGAVARPLMLALGEAASKDLGLGPVTASNWRQAALNPRISALGTGLYDADLYKHSGGNWAKALASYNGTGPQAQAYGLDVNANAQKIEIQLGGSIDITHSGVKVGTGQVGPHIQARTSSPHSIDTSKKHVGAQSYGPDQRPPSPGLPNLPGHIK